MTKVASLISQIKGKLPKTIQARVTKLENLEKELLKAKELKEAEPTEANVEAFNEIDELTNELADSIAIQLEAIIVEENKTPTPAPITEVTPVQPAVPPVDPNIPPTEPVEKKKSQNGWWIAAGLGALLVTVTAVFLGRPKE